MAISERAAYTRSLDRDQPRSACRRAEFMAKRRRQKKRRSRAAEQPAGAPDASPANSAPREAAGGKAAASTGGGGSMLAGGAALLFCGFFVFGLLAFAFWLWMLIDCCMKDHEPENEKLVWVLVIVFTGIIGAGFIEEIRDERERRASLNWSKTSSVVTVQEIAA